MFILFCSHYSNYLIYKKGIIMDEELTKYELARLIGARALQLSAGAPPLIKAVKDAGFIQVAESEMGKGILPLSVLR
jgi:DNA-directed RNA polymerase subunit K/omega